MNECVVCGFPALRPEGHASWCEMVAERNRLHNERIEVRYPGIAGVDMTVASSDSAGASTAPIPAAGSENGAVGVPSHSSASVPSGGTACLPEDADGSTSTKANGAAVNGAVCETTTA